MTAIFVHRHLEQLFLNLGLQNFVAFYEILKCITFYAIKHKYLDFPRNVVQYGLLNRLLYKMKISHWSSLKSIIANPISC